MSEPSGLTSVIVVAADSGATLGACIERALASDAALELIVADNATADGSIVALAQRHHDDSRLRIINNRTNIGFAAACNRAAAAASGDLLVFLNPDCMLKTDTLTRMREVMAQLPRTGLIGVCICEADGRPARVNARRDPLLRRALMTMSGLAFFGSRRAALTGVEMQIGGDQAQLVEAVSGALMAVPRPIFAQVGGFDGAYFLHCEDLDLCRRIRDAGADVVFAGAIKVVHLQGSSSRRRPVFVAWHKHRGMWRWFRNHDPAAHNPLLRVVVFVGIWLHFALRLPILTWRGWLARRH